MILIQKKDLIEVELWHSDNKIGGVLRVSDWENDILVVRRVKELCVKVNIVLPEGIMEGESFRWVMMRMIMLFILVWVCKIVLMIDEVMSFINMIIWWVEVERCWEMGVQMMKMESKVGWEEWRFLSMIIVKNRL